MTEWMNIEVAPAVAAAAVLCALVVVTSLQVARYRDRAAALRAANELLRIHQEAAAFVFNSERAPLRLREKLLFFCDTIFDRPTFLAIITEVCRDGGGTGNGDAKAFAKDLNALRGQDEELVEAYETAIRTAISAMVLRDPHASLLAQQFSIVRVVADKRSEMAVFSRAVRIGKQHDREPPRAMLIPA